MAKVCLRLSMANETQVCSECPQALHTPAHSLHEASGQPGSSLRPTLRLQNYAQTIDLGFIQQGLFLSCRSRPQATREASISEGVRTMLLLHAICCRTCPAFFVLCSIRPE